MKSYSIKIRYSRVLLSLLLFPLSFSVHPDSDYGLVFDPNGQYIDFPVVDRNITLSSYDVDDIDASFEQILKLNAQDLFLKDADLTNGIKGEIYEGGYISLTVKAYDRSHIQHVIYQSYLDFDSPDDYSPGVPTTTEIAIYKGDTDTHKVIEVEKTDIKMMLQSVHDTFSITSENYVQYLRSVEAVARFGDSASNRDRRFTIPVAIAFNPTGVLALAGAIGSNIATYVYSKINPQAVVPEPLIHPIFSSFANDDSSILQAVDKLTQFIESKYNNIEFFNQKYPVLGSISDVPSSKIDLDHPLYPANLYPVQVSLEMKNAKFYGARVPGLMELTPTTFEIWHNFSSQYIKQLVVTEIFWQTSPGVLNEGDSEVVTPNQAWEVCSSCVNELTDLTNSTRGWVRLTASPGGDLEESSYDFYPSSSRSDHNEPLLKLGEHIILEVVAPIQPGSNFDENNPEHYPRLENFPYTWMAFFSGEALYQCEPSIQPGEWKPWLGYDSQVHGTAMRKHREEFNPKFYDWDVDTSTSGFVVFRWTTKMTRRMDADISSYGPVITWPKQKTSPVQQRNNQKEGLNMELLRAWKDNTRATDSTPDFASYEGNRILPGLDPDEFLYLRNSDATVTDIITLDGEPWKQVPTGEAANPLNDIVTAYKKNRMWHVDDKDYRSVYGNNYASNSYEIQDLGTTDLAPNGNETGNNAAPGNIIIQLPSFAPGDSEVNLWLNVETHLSEDKGFYGNISGPIHPSIWETGVPYLITGLDSGEAMNYAVSFIHENSLGQRRYFNIFSENETDFTLGRLRDYGNWSVTLPSMRGYGYYTVNLWHRNNRLDNSWTRIGGKELLDINLRFMSVPAGKNGFSATDYPGVALKESPGDGAHIYLDDFLDSKQVDYGAWRFNRYGKTHNRTYVFHEGDTTTFEVFDADPHTFTHRGTEWYLSSRTQAKRITDAQLRRKLKFYIDPIESNGKVTKDGKVDARGKKFTHRWRNEGIYQLKAVYGGTTSLSHRIIVVNPSARQNGRKGDISKRRLTNQEREWLIDDGVEFGSNHPYLVSIDNVDSIYRYIDGPRMHTGGQVNRFHPGLDYADGYKWKMGQDTLVNYDLNSNYAPSGLAQAIAAFRDGAGWLPHTFVRHTSEKNSDNEPMPDDIANGSVSVSKFSSLSSNQENRINSLFNDAPEPWQVRLPWISFVTDPDPYQTDADVYSYRTRTNIKVIYDMDAFFDNNNGAFSGNPVDPTGGNNDASELVRRGVYLHLMNDDTKLKREFYRNLATGRMIIYNGNSFDAHVSNAKGDGTVIADYSTSD